MAESKYGKYILREPKGEDPPIIKATAQHFRLSEELMSGIDKINCQFNISGILQPFVTDDPPHKHDCDELLFFIPGDPKNAPDLGGEVEIALGEEWEKHVINTPAIICLPKGVQHCPVHIKKVDRPFYFGHCLLASELRQDSR